MKISKQSYKIYINDKVLHLVKKEHFANLQMSAKCLKVPYSGSKKSLFQYLDTLEKSSRFDEIALQTDDLDTLYQDFKSLFKWVPAAGGIIRRKDGRILMIFRRNVWDLPKGKLDDNEKPRAAAIRECEEETGLQNLKMISKLKNTFHIYRDNENKRVLKKTSWYILHAPMPDQIKVQIEEQIERADWMSKNDSLDAVPVLLSIHELVGYYWDLPKLA